MIPNKVYDNIKYASNYNHGAELDKGDKKYSLRNKNGYVEATVFIPCNTSQREKLEKQGYTTSEKFAWKSIPLNQVPDSQALEWHCWDEY